MASKETKVQGLTLYVTDEHIYHKGEFIFHCKELNMTQVILSSKELDLAMWEASNRIETFLAGKLAAVQAIRQQIKVG